MTPLRDSSPTRIPYSYSRTSPVRMLSPYEQSVVMANRPAPLKECAPELCAKVANLFKTIALEESDIERLRQDFGTYREFTRDQKALFRVFDKDDDGKIALEEMQAFLTDQKVEGVQAAAAVIAEFDSTQDGQLNFDEFLNIFLPAGGVGLRSAEWHADPRVQTLDGGLPSSVTSMAARILEREIAFLTNRAQAQDAFDDENGELDEVTLTDMFNQISRGRPEIMMTDLIWFCERQGFMPSTEDLEAILRRCDHDADRCISFEEFCETVGVDFEGLMKDRKAREDKEAAERELKLEEIRQ